MAVQDTTHKIKRRSVKIKDGDDRRGISVKFTFDIFVEKDSFKKWGSML
jgi:hypothetical protein